MCQKLTKKSEHGTPEFCSLRLQRYHQVEIL